MFQLSDLPEVSDEARRMARLWDHAPEDVRLVMKRLLESTATPPALEAEKPEK